MYSFCLAARMELGALKMLVFVANNFFYFFNGPRGWDKFSDETIS